MIILVPYKYDKVMAIYSQEIATYFDHLAQFLEQYQLVGSWGDMISIKL